MGWDSESGRNGPTTVSKEQESFRFIDGYSLLRLSMLRRKELTFEVSTTPINNIKAMRKLAEQKEWEMRRHEGSRLVDRFAIIMPMAQSARTLGLEILNGPLQGLEMHSWAETKGSAGAINMAAWTIPGGQGNTEAMDFIREWTLSLPRCPWKWTFGERSKIGYLLPVWRRSRKAFRKIGLKEWSPAKASNHES